MWRQLGGSVVVVSLLASCTETGEFSKTESGAMIGAVAGAAIGAAVSDDKGKGAVIGAVAGGLVGAGVGKMLDERDRQRLAQSTEKTIVTGAPEKWSNPQTGVQAQTTVKETVAKQEQRQIPVLKDKVQQVPPLEFIGEDYVATNTVNVRGGPGADYVVVGELQAGQVTRVVGKVTGADWYMISKDNVGSGFVSSGLLKPAGTATMAKAPQAPAAPAPGVSQATVAATKECRVVTQQVTKNGQTSSQDVKACRGPNGWEIVSA
jgi:uncharacterized protein YgiM (DUF1202 family)